MCPYAFWIEFSKFLLPFVIGGATLYIAWQQWQTNKLKLQLERYDRRFRIYDETKKMLSLISHYSKASHDDLLKFRLGVSEADFLFKPGVPKYLEEIYNHGVDLEYWNQQNHALIQNEPTEHDQKTIHSSRKAELDWLNHQLPTVKQIFEEYLDLNDYNCVIRIRQSALRFLRRLRGFLTYLRTLWPSSMIG